MLCKVYQKLQSAIRFNTKMDGPVERPVERPVEPCGALLWSPVLRGTVYNHVFVLFHFKTWVGTARGLLRSMSLWAMLHTAQGAMLRVDFSLPIEVCPDLEPKSARVVNRLGLRRTFFSVAQVFPLRFEATRVDPVAWTESV